VFSVILGICFSLKANPNGMKTLDSGALLAQTIGVNPSNAGRAFDSPFHFRQSLVEF
jgi:hypothetical protein